MALGGLLRWGAAASLVTAFSLVSVAAFAEESAPASSETESARVALLHLIYEAPSGCPDRDAFIALVSSHTERAGWVQDPVAGEAALAVQVVASAGGYVGELAIQRPWQPPSRRSFEEATCAEVVAALALVTALTVDPSAHEPAAPGSAPPSTPAGEIPVKPSPRPRPPLPAPPPRRTGSPAPRLVLGSPIERSSRPADLDVTLGAALGATWGPAPEALVAVGPAAEVTARLVRQWRLGLSVAPAIASTGFIGRAIEEASFRWLAGRVAACSTYDFSRRFRAGPCVRSDLGALSVAARDPDVTPVETRPRLWASVGPGATLSYSSVATLSLRGSLLSPLTLDRFFVRPKEPGEWSFEPSLLGGSVELTAGVRFPRSRDHRSDGRE